MYSTLFNVFFVNNLDVTFPFSEATLSMRQG